MLVEQQVELIEGRSGDLPVMFLVQIPDRHGIGEQLVEILDRLLAGGFRQRDRKLDEMPKGLNFVRLLMHVGLGVIQDCIGVKYRFAHDVPCSSCYSCSTWWTKETEIEPSPTADATRLIFPDRTSPTAKTPGKLVSSRCGRRASGQRLANKSSGCISCPVLMNPVRPAPRTHR